MIERKLSPNGVENTGPRNIYFNVVKRKEGIMQRDFCDMCAKEIETTEDIRVVKVTDLKGKPVIKAKEICIFCFDKLKENL